MVLMYAFKHNDGEIEFIYRSKIHVISCFPGDWEPIGKIIQVEVKEVKNGNRTRKNQ